MCIIYNVNTYITHGFVCKDEEQCVHFVFIRSSQSARNWPTGGYHWDLLCQGPWIMILGIETDRSERQSNCTSHFKFVKLIIYNKAHK